MAPDCPGVAAKQSHSVCPQSWQSRCQSRLTCLCVLCHGHFTSARAPDKVALTPPPSLVSTGQAESKQEPRPLGPGTLPTLTLPGARLAVLFPTPSHRGTRSHTWETQGTAASREMTAVLTMTCSFSLDPIKKKKKKRRLFALFPLGPRGCAS